MEEQRLRDEEIQRLIDEEEKKNTTEPVDEGVTPIVDPEEVVPVVEEPVDEKVTEVIDIVDEDDRSWSEWLEEEGWWMLSIATIAILSILICGLALCCYKCKFCHSSTKQKIQKENDLRK